MLIKGDYFYRKSKYGSGGIIGQVQNVSTKIVVNLSAHLNLEETYIIATTGVVYDASELIKIHSFRDPEDDIKLSKALYDMSTTKAEILREHKNME